MIDPDALFDLYPNLTKIYNIDQSLTRETSFEGHIEDIYSPNHEETLLYVPEFGHFEESEPEDFTYRPIIFFRLYEKDLEKTSEEQRLSKFQGVLLDRLDELNGTFEEFIYKGDLLSNAALGQAFQEIISHGHSPPSILRLSHWDSDITDLLKSCGNSLKHLELKDSAPFTLAEICLKIPWKHLPKIESIWLNCNFNKCEFASQELIGDLRSLAEAASDLPEKTREVGRITLYLSSIYDGVVDDGDFLNDRCSTVQFQHDRALMTRFMSEMRHFVDVLDPEGNLW
ncbi:hypothetical protein V866_004914 [Kwoniella sp. B9012]